MGESSFGARFRAVLPSAVLFVVAAGLATDLIRPFRVGQVGFDMAASVLFFDRIVVGRHLESFISATPKPLFTVVNGLAHAVTGEWRLISWLAIGVYAVEFLTPSRGIGFPVNLMLLEVACAISFITAIVCISNPRGTTRRLESFPFLLVALAGASTLILHAAEDIGRKGFGSISIEDGVAVAALTATAWIIGALWMAGAPRRGAMLVALATLNVVIPFITLHLAKGGVSLDQIAKQSGAGWAVLAAAMAILAAASLIGSVSWLAWKLAAQARARIARKPKPAPSRT